MKGKTESALSLRNESLCKVSQWQLLVLCTASLRLSLGSTQREAKTETRLRKFSPHVTETDSQ